MGQYHKVVNLDKRQFLHAHKMGDGLKLLEFGCSSEGVMTGLALLLGCSAREGGRGGGDPREDIAAADLPQEVRERLGDRTTLIGSWAGDRIAIIGDYAEDEDLPSLDASASQLYNACDDGEFTDISEVVMVLMRRNGVARNDERRGVLRPDFLLYGEGQ